MGANEDELESLIRNLLDRARFLHQEKIVDLINQLYEISKSESIPPTEVPAYINQKLEEKRRIEDEIEKFRAILDKEKIDIQLIEEYKRLKEELEMYGLPIDNPDKVVPVLQTINQIGYDPRKIVRELARIKSLSLEERRLKKNCKVLASRATRYSQVLRLCEQVVRVGIGIEELMAYHSAIVKRSDEDGIPIGAAPYRVMMDIDQYNRLGGLKKELNNTMVNLQMMNLVAARQNIAANIVMRL